MLRFFLITSCLIFANSDDTTTTTAATFPTDAPSIYCDYFPDPSTPDEGNYGDGFCAIDAVPDEKLLLRKSLITFDGQTFFGDSYHFPGTVVTRVSLVNFGRYHGATNAIGILHEFGEGRVEIYVDIFLGKGVRMMLEIYGL